MERIAAAVAMAGCGVVLVSLLYMLSGMLFRRPASRRPEEAPLRSLTLPARQAPGSPG